MPQKKRNSNQERKRQVVMFPMGNAWGSLQCLVRRCLGKQPLGRIYAGPDCYRKALLRKIITRVYIMLFIPKLWQSNRRNEMHCNLWLSASKGGFTHTAELCSLPLTTEALLPSRFLDVKARARQLVLLPLPRMLLTICLLFPLD